MNEPLPILIENSVQIAWDFLDLSGEIADPAEASKFLQQAIADLVMKGERRRMMLSNKAITAYKKFKEQRLKAA